MPGYPSRESVLAGLRSAVLREEPCGPCGGLPEMVRVDRGKDFLSRTVTAAFDLLDVTVEDLPAYTPHLKRTVEGLNRAVESMPLASLPGYARQPRPGKRACRPKDEVLLGFEDFTTQLLPGRRPRPRRPAGPSAGHDQGTGASRPGPAHSPGKPRHVHRKAFGRQQEHDLQVRTRTQGRTGRTRRDGQHTDSAPARTVGGVISC